jgi:hypothetical protein
MANLDDFFKKKDGKKTKGQKFSVSNLSLSQKQSEKNGKVKQEKPTSYNSVLNENDLFSSQHTDEWKDFVEEEKKDYSGLKIQNLQINDDDDGKQDTKPESEEETEIDEQGHTVVRKKTAGPWKLPEPKKEEVKPPVKVEERPKPVEPPQSSVYVPPSKRNQGFNREPSRSTKKTSNDLTSEEMFPALGTVLGDKKSKLK